MQRSTPASAPTIAGWAHLAGLAVAVAALAAIAGCGGESGDAAPQSAATAAETDSTPDHPATPARLRIVGAHAEPYGPTTSATIPLAFSIANGGQSPTPSHREHGAYGYVPIVWRVLRDDQIVGQGEILGLMPGDIEPVRLTLLQEPPGDKTYRVEVDPDGRLGLPDAVEPQAIHVAFASRG